MDSTSRLDGLARAFWVSMLLTLAVHPLRALAEPTAAERETARSLMDEADRMRAAGDVWHALERYKAADQLMRVPTTGLEVARAQAQLMQLVEARASAVAVAVSAPSPNEPAVFARARAAATTLANQLAPRIPSVTVAVEPVGVPYSVSIDGVRLPESARNLPFKLNPGGHNVLVEAAGYETLSNQVALAESQAADLHLTLIPSAKPVVAVVPAVVPAPSPVETAKTAASAGERDSDPNAAGRTRGYVGLGVGGAVLTTGIVIGIMAVIKTNDVKNACPNLHCPANAQSDLDTAKTLSNVANVTVPLGLLGVGYGVFELLTHSSGPAEHATTGHVTVGLSFNNPGLTVRGAL